MSALFRNDRAGAYPDSWYAATCTPPPPRAALKGARHADVAILGAGYTGLWAALTLARSGLKVAVVEAHRVGFGASGRNGGQVGSGFNKDQTWLEAHQGPGPARALWDIAQDAKAQLREFCQTRAPDARYRPGVISGGWSAREVDALHAYGAHLQVHYGYDTTPLDAGAMAGIVKSPVYRGGLLDEAAGHVHPLAYALALAREAEAAGATIYEQSAVTQVVPGTKVQMATDQGTITADHAILAGNGYMPDLAAPVAARVMPINSFIAATAPLGAQAAEVLARDVAVADDKFVVNYFRLSHDGRLLFGGRESYSIGFPKDITTRLRARMCTLFPHLHGVPVEYVWGGTLGITMTRLPHVARLAPNMMSAAGFSGHGVALAGMAGRVMGEAVLGQAARFGVLSDLPTPPFPGGVHLRSPLLVLAMTWYALRDRLGI